jgi:hypothetical protein
MIAPSAPAPAIEKRQPYTGQDETKERALLAKLRQAIAEGDWTEVQRIQGPNHALCSG